MKLSPNKKAIQVVCALLIRENKLLLGLRPPGKHLGGHWELPGGKVEENESYVSALYRELKEELNITIDQDQCSYLTSVVHSYPEKTIELHVIRVESYSGQLKNLEAKKFFLSLNRFH